MTDGPAAEQADPAPRDDLPRRHGAREVLAWMTWLGLVTGGVELASMVLKSSLVTSRNYNVSRHFLWMYPVSGVLVMLGPGLLLAMAARVRRGGLPAHWVVGVLSYFAYLSVLYSLPVFTVACHVLAAGLAAQTARLLRARPRGPERLVRLTLGPLAALLIATVACSYGRTAWPGRQGPFSATAARGAKNVILIVLDTVRARSLSLYGYGRDTSPNLRRIAARGVRFDCALSTAPWTAPSHSSMFTGRWPHELSVGWNRPLDARHPTLAGFLAARGYRTAGFVANTTYCSYETGLDRGFARYEDYDVTPRAILLCSSLVRRTLNTILVRAYGRLGKVAGLAGQRKDAARINRDFLDWLPARGEGPFFAFLNYYDAHHPYLSPDEHDLAEGRRPRSVADNALLKQWWTADKRRLTPAEVELIRDSYDRCLAYLDDQLGRLFRELSRRGVLDDTVVVITSDHGEHLGEQRLYGHGCSLYRPELHVPLLVLAPGDAAPRGRAVAEPVSLRDLPATVVDLLGLSGESPFPGRSLARTWSDDRPPAGPAGWLLSEIDRPPEVDPNGGRSPVNRGPMLSLVADGWHYIRNGDGREELYDFARDPGEEHDLAGTPAAAGVIARTFRGAAGLRR